MPLSALGTLLAVSIAGTLVSSAASGALLERVGAGGVLMVSTLLVTASAAMLASSRSWSWAMAGALVGGFGAGAVDAVVNAHAPVSSSARSMTWLHATCGVGAMLGPVIMTTALGSGLGWRAGYAALAAPLTALTLAFALSQSLWASPPRGGGRSPDADAVVSDPVPPRIAVGLGLFWSGLAFWPRSPAPSLSHVLAVRRPQGRSWLSASRWRPSIRCRCRRPRAG